MGAHAVSAHGFVRGTADLDVFVRPTAENADAVHTALLQFGAPADLVAADELSQPDQVFQIGVAPVRIDVLTGLSGVDFEEAWGARIEVELDGLTVPVIGRDQLIANKKATGRPRDLLDVEWLEGRGEG